VGLDRPQPGQAGDGPVGPKAEVQPPNAEEAGRLLAAAMEESAELGLFLRLAVVLGARRGELCSLRWSDIDVERGEVLIASNVVRVPRQALVHKDTKTHAKRRVAVGAGTLDMLRRRRVEQAEQALAFGVALPADAYVFSHVPDGTKPIDPDRISHRFLRLARRLGVICRLHDLRHFMVTQLVAVGVDWSTVSGRAGHADGHMTLATYAHFQQAQDRQAAELMERLLIPGGAAIEAGRHPPETSAMAAAAPTTTNALWAVLKELGWSQTQLADEPDPKAERGEPQQQDHRQAQPGGRGLVGGTQGRLPKTRRRWTGRRADPVPGAGWERHRTPPRRG
jgi:hypothetical protein